MTLKYHPDHWKQYEWVKLKEYYHHEKLDIYHIVSEKIETLEFLPHMDTQPAGRPNTDHYRLTFSMHQKQINMSWCYVDFMKIMCLINFWKKTQTNKKAVCTSLRPIKGNFAENCIILCSFFIKRLPVDLSGALICVQHNFVQVISFTLPSWFLSVGFFFPFSQTVQVVQYSHTNRWGQVQTTEATCEPKDCKENKSLHGPDQNGQLSENM